MKLKSCKLIVLTERLYINLNPYIFYLLRRFKPLKLHENDKA